MRDIGKFFCFIFTLANLVKCSVSQSAATIKCGACKLLINELEKNVKKVDPKKKVEVGSFRVDPSGNQLLNEVSYARSDMHLHDLLEKICENTTNYGLTNHPTTKRPVIVDLHEVGQSGNKAVIDTSDFIKSKLKTACYDVIEHFEDEIVAFLKKEFKDPAELFCHRYHDFCQKDDFVSFPDVLTSPESNSADKMSAGEL